METTDRSGLRERARRAVRTEIAEIAFTLFVRQGFEQTTVDEIAEAAGLSRRSFFRYFPSKEDTVFGFLYDMGSGLAEAVGARPAEETPWTALRMGFHTLAGSFMARSKDATALMKLIFATPALRARHQDKQDHWRQLLTEALRGRAGSALEADVLASAALSIFDVVCRQWLAPETTEPPDVLLDRAFGLLSPG